ncbi:MAG: hypothetical protein RL033_4136 [Pseudomonadota bacterium]
MVRGESAASTGLSFRLCYWMQMYRMGTALGCGVLGAMLSSCSEGSGFRTYGEPGSARGSVYEPGVSDDQAPAGRPPPLAGSVRPPPFTEGLRVCPPESDPRVSGMTVGTQSALDALEGCERIDHDFTISAFVGMDLTPLRSLREVRGRLTIGNEYTLAGPPVLSLEGLEGLRHLRGLTLHGLQVSDLSSLRDLEWLGKPTDGDFGIGGPALRITGAAQLVDLHGLEDVQGIYGLLVLECPNLRSLEGVHFAQDPEGWGGIYVSDSPVQSFGDLSALTQIGTLALSHSPLESLEGLRSLRRIQFVSLSQNEQLEDVELLAQLDQLQVLELQLNPRLTTVPDLPLLSEMSAVQLRSNHALVRAPAVPGITALNELTVNDNPALERLDGFAALHQLGEGYVSGNERLGGLDLASLAEITRTLYVIGNPQLDVNLLLGSAPAQSGHLKANGNLGEQDLLAPCPWPDDDVCDEPPDHGLCAPGTDPICELTDG